MAPLFEGDEVIDASCHKNSTAILFNKKLCLLGMKVGGEQGGAKWVELGERFDKVVLGEECSVVFRKRGSEFLKISNVQSVKKRLFKIEGDTIRRVELGAQHLLVLTENGNVYGLGDNSSNQLSFENFESC